MKVRVEELPKLTANFARPARTRVFKGGRGSGKCLGAGTMLLRHDASLVAVEDVKTGDALMGPDGEPRNVLGTTRGVGPLFQVNQATGMSFVCNDAHILVLERSKNSREDCGEISAAGNPQRPNGRYGKYDTGLGYSLITADEYASKTERFKAHHFGFRRAILGAVKELPVDPYLLGVWLGDGSSKAPEVTNIDQEIIDYLRDTAAANGWEFTKIETANRVPRYYLGSKFKRAGSFVRQLRAAGVFENKHIPEAYFGASIDQRRSLLAGLVDTDGHVSTGCIEISQSREAMIDQIVRLAHGLGFKASKRHKPVSCNGRICSSWKVQIGGDIDTLPLLISRKREASNVRKNKDWRRTRVDVSPIGVGEYFGFELDGDHLFMLADGTVTHNTRGLAKRSALRIYQLAEMGVEGVFLASREHLNSLDESSMEEIKQAIRSEPWLADYFDIGEKYIRTKNRRINYAFAGLRHNLDSIKSKARIIGNWTDEAEAVSEMAWRKLIPTLREEGEGWHVENWISYNPESPDSATHKRFIEQQSDDCIVTEVNYTDNPWFPDVLNRQRLQDQRLRPETYDHTWNGAFLTLTDAQIFAGKYVVDEFEPDEEWDGPYQGGDFGFSQDPAAAVRCWVGHDPYARDGLGARGYGDNCLWIEYEAGKIALELDDYAEHIGDRIPNFDQYVTRWDSAQPGMISHIKRHGLNRSEGVEKWAGSVEDGIAFMRNFDKIIVHPRCTSTAREFRLYSYKVDRLTEDVLPIVVDAHNHWLDATRYALGPMVVRKAKSAWIMTRD